jgi:hypothetical protein
MESSVDQPSIAWQPFTPRGVAAFARASVGRLLVMQFVAALLAAGTVVWFLNTCWFPTVGAAIDRLPESGAVKSGRLNWEADSPRSLVESRFLAFAIDLNHGGSARSPAHVQVEFGQSDLRIYSLFGCLQIPYPRTYAIPFNVQELKPWWGAWAPVFLAVSAFGVVLGLFLSWAALATLYCLPVWLAGLYFDRELTLFGSWRLAGAALVPGAIVQIVALGFYGLGRLDLIRFIAASAAHLVLGLVYLILGTMASPKCRLGPDLKNNPFATGAVASDPSAAKAVKIEQANPFRTSRD